MQAFTRLARPLLAKQSSAMPRTFTTLSPLRPTLTPSRRPNAITSFTPTPSSSGSVADLVPRTAISAHPALAGAQQLRCGPRNTMNGHTRLVQKRRHGWLHRMRSKSGRRILLRRKLKGRRHVAW